MSTDQSIANFVVEQMQNAGTIRAKKMFGEYAVYCNETVVALICDDQLFVKPTKAGRDFIGVPVEAAPYPGAKPYYLISGERWDDSEWICTLVQYTFHELSNTQTKRSPSKARTKRNPKR